VYNWRVVEEGGNPCVEAFRSPATVSENSLMSTHASFPVDSVGPPRAEVCRTAASFP
jgi:hypothetical protein